MRRKKTGDVALKVIHVKKARVAAPLLSSISVRSLMLRGACSGQRQGRFHLVVYISSCCDVLHFVDVGFGLGQSYALGRVGGGDRLLERHDASPRSIAGPEESHRALLSGQAWCHLFMLLLRFRLAFDVCAQPTLLHVSTLVLLKSIEHAQEGNQRNSHHSPNPPTGPPRSRATRHNIPCPLLQLP